MGTKRSLLEVDPLYLPLGMQVDAWRIRGWRGRGGYGTVYRVELEGGEGQGSFALKLATYPGDERFEREAWLLSRIHSPHVPKLYAQGVWEHASGAFPYLVMEWVEGEPLYEWAARRNPTERQMVGLLAQVARALEATHAAGGVHRDVKGGNVLMRPADGRVFLTDFGAGYYRSAATLTSKLLPPGTPAYRSPEAWGFLHLFLRHPTVHYPASACDDLFALGVMAYRLVTDEYPPSTFPEVAGAEVWREGGPGPRPLRDLNPRVSAKLDALILRLLAIAPEERFRGLAGEAAKTLERVAEEAGPEADAPSFSWGRGRSPRLRSPEGVQLAEQQDAAARNDVARHEGEMRVRSEARIRQTPLRPRVPVWGVEVSVAGLGLLLACLLVAWLHRWQGGAQTSSGTRTGEDDAVAVGDSARTPPAAAFVPMPAGKRVPAVGRPLPEKLLPGQRRPPCNRTGEVEIRGGCWYALRATPPCKEEGKEEAYDWKGACYMPSFPTGREPTADPP
ncbi:serine/threonine-protein kinase [Hyalangium sp.]|uniref:serine/threonine protein kinase n=1 Tax=Hyalangium sp. TaxID=2028555 RepID=UPI002D667CC1|nr:serine/threonine-protein kinase [Hyalangium sp.]HYH97641.1 serine/threonine-protein kinase [Hyalangium sp.]